MALADIPVAAASQTRINEAVQVILQQWKTPRALDNEIVSGDPNAIQCPDVVERMATVNRVGIGLWRMQLHDDAVHWYRACLPDANRVGMGAWIRVNLAVVLMDKGEHEEAADLLRPMVEESPPESGNEYSEGLRVLAAGILGYLLEEDGKFEAACQVYTKTTERELRVGRDYVERAWPGLYTGMTYVWRLHALHRQGVRRLPEALLLQKEFMNAVPLNRWTWCQHQYFHEAVLQLQSAQSGRAVAGLQ